MLNMRKPKPSDFNISTSDILIVERELEETKRYNKKVSIIIYCSLIFPITLLILPFVINKHEEPFFYIQLIIGLFLFGFFVSFIHDEINEKIKKGLSQDRKNKIQELETKNNLISQYKIALSRWNYFNSRNEEGFWRALRGIELEKEVSNLFRNNGFITELTQRVGDEGIDIIMSKGDQNLLVQCKGLQKKLGVGAIRDAIGVKSLHPHSSMIVVCPAGFTAPSKKLALTADIQLMQASDLISLLKKL